LLFELKSFPEFRHLNKERNHVVFDENSSRLLLVDDHLLTVLLNIQSLEEEGLAELRRKHGQTDALEIAVKTMQELVNARVLKPKSTTEPQLTVGIKGHEPRINFMLLNVSMACQLACKYCFAEGGHYGRPEHQTIMSWDVAKAAIDMMDFRDVEGYSIAVGFFGGEPLMNWDVIENSIRYVKQITAEYKLTRVAFNMTTNGIGLTSERAKFLLDNDCRPMISIDGCESTHNSMRPAKASDLNSWKSSVQGYETWLSLGGPPLTVRATITAKDTDVVSMNNLFRGIGFGAINSQLVQTEDPDLKLSLQQLHQFEGQQIALLNDDVTKSTDLRRVFDALRQAHPRTRFCGVGHSGYAVQPNGDIFLCHRFATDDTFKIGHVSRGLDSGVLDRFTGWSTNSSPSCFRCWARHICGGGCYAENYFATGDPVSPNPERCYLTKSMLYHSIEFLVQNSDNIPTLPLQSIPEC